MSAKNKILSQISLYSFGTQTAQVITLLATILSRRFLGPTQTGIWTTLQILVEYSKYSSLGTMDAVSREIPYRVGKGDLAAAEKTKNLAATFVFTGSLTIAIGIVLFAFFTQGYYRSEITTGLYLVAAVIFLQRVNNLFIALLRCYKRFEIESAFVVISAIANALLVSTLTYFFKIYGFIWALIFSFLFNILFIRSQYAFNLRWDYDLKALKPLVSYGLPLMVLGILTTLFRSLDRIFIAKYLGFESLGWYSIALMVTSYVSNFPIAIGIVLLPHFQEKYGEKDNPDDLRHYLEKAVTSLALILPVVLCFAALAAPYAVRAFLPKFLPGLASMKILILGIYFISIGQIYYDTLITVKKQWFLFPALAAAGILTAAGDLLAVHGGHGIYGVAAATTGGFVFYFTVLHAITAVSFRSKFFSAAFLQIILIFVYFAGFLFWVNPENAGDFSFQVALKDTGLFCFFALPLLWILNQRFQVLGRVREKLSKLGKKP